MSKNKSLKNPGFASFVVLNEAGIVQHNSNKNTEISAGKQGVFSDLELFTNFTTKTPRHEEHQTYENNFKCY